MLQSTGNCVEDFDSVLVGSDYQSNSNVPEESPEPRPFQVEESDYRLHEFENNLAGMNAITYVSDFLAIC